MFAVEINGASSQTEAQEHSGESWCQGCQKWYKNSKWIFQETLDNHFIDPGTRYLYAGSDGTRSGLGEVTELSYVGDAEEPSEVYECPNCYAFIGSLNTEDPAYHEYSHLCGACGEAWSSLDGAQSCCEDERNPRPDPEVFAKAARGEY